MIVIDIFSKFLFVETLKDKKASTVLKGFIKILDKGRQPQTVFLDKGGEFNNALLKRELTKRNIKYFTTQNEDIKTSIAERVIRTLKNKLYRLFHKLGSYRYIETLQKVVEGYNKSKHKSLHNHATADVTKNNEALIWDSCIIQSQRSYQRLLLVNLVKVGRFSNSKLVATLDYRMCDITFRETISRNGQWNYLR